MKRGTVNARSNFRSSFIVCVSSGISNMSSTPRFSAGSIICCKISIDDNNFGLLFFGIIGQHNDFDFTVLSPTRHSVQNATIFQDEFRCLPFPPVIVIGFRFSVLDLPFFPTNSIPFIYAESMCCTPINGDWKPTVSSLYDKISHGTTSPFFRCNRCGNFSASKGFCRDITLQRPLNTSTPDVRQPHRGQRHLQAAIAN